MQNKRIVFGSIFVLIVAFFGLTSVYQSSQTSKIQNYASSKGAPFVQPYSVKFGKNKKNVTIVEFLDPECEACGAFHPAVKKVFNEYDEDIQLVVRYLANHKNSSYVVKLLESARIQNRYNEVLNIVFDTQPIWAKHGSSKPKMLWNFLTQVEGLDLQKLRTDFESIDISEILLQDRKDATQLGVRGTPTFFVNGKKVNGLSYQNLLDSVESEIYK